jgi:hypothetical protein
VLSSPLKNLSQLGLLFPIYGQIKNVPNHQPDIVDHLDDHPMLDSGLCVDDRWLGASRRQRQKCWVFPSQSGDLWDLTIENDDFIEFNGMLMGICSDTTNKLIYTMSVMSIKDGQ